MIKIIIDFLKYLLFEVTKIHAGTLIGIITGFSIAFFGFKLSEGRYRKTLYLTKLDELYEILDSILEINNNIYSKTRNCLEIYKNDSYIVSSKLNEELEEELNKILRKLHMFVSIYFKRFQNRYEDIRSIIDDLFNRYMTYTISDIRKEEIKKGLFEAFDMQSNNLTNRTKNWQKKIIKLSKKYI